MIAPMLDVVLTAAAMPVAIASGYLLVLALASRRSAPPRHPEPRLRFEIVVPAHDEEDGIAATVESLLRVEYPRDLRRVTVVADNCRDATAARAREAEARVLERNDTERRGKGYALAHGFSRILEEGWADAIVVVDADTIVSPNLLRAFSARLEEGAEAVQAEYGVRNPGASWRTRLMTVAFAMTGTLRSLARERLRCTAGLKGNGMCFSARLLRAIPYDAFSVVEDAEYTVRLARARRRVHFAAEAEVRGEIVSTEKGARSQRRRWEEGRRKLAREVGWPLLRRGIARRDGVQTELALDLLVPPLARLGAASAIGTIAAGVGTVVVGRPLVALFAWAATLASIIVYVVRGWSLSGTGWDGLCALLYAPAYLAWKIGLRLTRDGRGADVWVRTRREGARAPDAVSGEREA